MKRIYLLLLVSVVFAASANSQCDAPISVIAHNSTSNTASVTFDGGTGTSFIVEYGLSGFTPGLAVSAGSGSSSVVTGAASPISITGLTSSATYDVSVRQVCAGPVYSGN
jgi:curli biogenesis system outer membrane secretion channel CsgG